MVTDGELVSIANLMIIAGNETTTNAINSAIELLVKHPEMQDRLRDNPDEIDVFIEETLRFEAPIQALFRLAVKDTEIGGVSVPAGSIVVLRWGAANRDPHVFIDPDEFDPDRAGARKHITFGYGSHFCLGSHLARKEIKIVLQRLLARTRNIRPASPEWVGRDASYIVRGFAKQEVVLDAK